MSLLWKTAVDSMQERALDRVRSIPVDPKAPDDITGSHLKDLLGEHNIHLHESHEDPTFGPVEHEVSHEGDLARHHPSEVLHTSQPSMQRSSLEHYIKRGHEHILKADGRGFHEANDPENDIYHPITYSHGGHWDAPHWIEDGHHRILAARMLGKTVTAESGWTQHCSCPEAKN